MAANDWLNWWTPAQPEPDSRLPSDSLREMHAAACRRLALLFGACSLVTFIVQAPPAPGATGWQLFLVTVGLLGICTASHLLAVAHIRAAQSLLLLGVAAFLLAMFALTRQPLAVVLFAGLPSLAVILLGWPAALITVLLTFLAPWAGDSLAGSGPSLAWLGWTSAGAGALLAVVVWLSYDGIIRLATSTLKELDRALQAVNDARSQRMELKQIEEDLLQATREQARLLERLKASNQAAEEARQTKQEFIAMVSHELRTPLNMVIAYSELITQSPHLYRGRVPAALLADMAVIHRNAQHLSKLVDDILDLSQIDAGRMALSKSWTDIAAVAREAAEAVRPLFETKRLALAVDTADAMPLVFCDQTRIRQVMINLLSNGGRFTEEGGVTLRVWEEADHLHITVRDTGPGIAPDQQAHLFEPFQQLDASIRRKHGGSGLGLNITKHFVEMHDGRIWLESELDKGTTFHVVLPVGTGAPPLLETPASKRWVNPYAAYEPRTRPRIAPLPQVAPRYVVMDYGRTLERLLGRYLENAEIVRVETLPEATRILGESPAQALVVNSAMLAGASWPQGDWAKLPFDTPLIACWLPDDDSSREVGSLKHLVKPVDVSTLQSALASLGDGINTVLVVDDEPDIQRLFMRMLTSGPKPYRVLTASNGREALAILHESHPDAVILDLLMPEMSGFELLQAKERDAAIRSIPVIVVSSLDPHSQPIVSNQLYVSRNSGLSSRELLDCIKAVSAVLAPDPRRRNPAQPTAFGE